MLVLQSLRLPYTMPRIAYRMGMTASVQQRQGKVPYPGRPTEAHQPLPWCVLWQATACNFGCNAVLRLFIFDNNEDYLNLSLEDTRAKINPRISNFLAPY